MKNKLLALSLMASLAGTATAQSNVTIYGVMDLGVAKRDGGTANNPGTFGPIGGWALQPAMHSRLGFRGTEDLGGGLSVQFDLMHMLLADTGASFFPNNFWGGKSIVQLTSTTLGSVYLGRDFIPAWWPAMFADPFTWDGVGQTSTNQWAGYLATAATRTNNAIGYKSPRWGGVTVQAMASLGEGGTGHDFGFNIQYRQGPIYAGLGFDRVTTGPAIPIASPGNQLINLAFAYDFGFVKPSVYYATSKTGGGKLRNSDAMIAATAPLAGGTLKLAYNRMDLSGPANNQTKLSVGYDFPLSKRTNLYLDSGFARQEGFSNARVVAGGIKHVF